MEPATPTDSGKVTQPTSISTVHTRTNSSQLREMGSVLPDHLPALPHYKMDKQPHGYALVINNKTFDSPLDGKPQLSTRNGTDADRDSLESALKALGYKIHVRNNLCAHEIENAFEEFSDEHTHVASDSCVCCLLSHGEEGKIWGKDNKVVKVRDLSRRLVNCKSLVGKPKIIFVQACQGTEKPDHIKRDDGEEEDPDVNVAFLPRDSDVFIGYATTPERVAMRNSSAGSWYIQELCEKLHENEHDLVTMVTLVHDAVATKPQYCYEWTDKSGKTYTYKQQPQMISMLRHRVKF